jgi:hypothetical protein
MHRSFLVEGRRGALKRPPDRAAIVSSATNKKTVLGKPDGTTSFDIPQCTATNSRPGYAWKVELADNSSLEIQTAVENLGSFLSILAILMVAESVIWL